METKKRKRGLNKTKEVQDVIFDSYVAEGFKKPSKSLIKSLQDQYNIADLNPHYTMIDNEWNGRGFGKADQRNHLPKHTMERIYSKKKELGLI